MSIDLASPGRPSYRALERPPRRGKACGPRETRRSLVSAVGAAEKASCFQKHSGELFSNKNIERAIIGRLWRFFAQRNQHLGNCLIPKVIVTDRRGPSPAFRWM